MKVIARCVTLVVAVNLFSSVSAWPAASKDKTPTRKIESPQKPETAIQSQSAGSINFKAGISDEVSPYNYDTAGLSYYDLQANQRNVRQIVFVPTNRNVAVAWAKSPTADLAIRNVVAALWCYPTHIDCFLTDIPMNGDLVGRSGYPGFTYLPKSSRVVLYGHHAETPSGTYFAPESAPRQFDWGTDIHAPDSLPGDLAPGIWSSAAGGFMIDVHDYDGDGGTNDSVETILFISTEWDNAVTTRHFIYSRGVDSLGTWIYPGFSGRIGMLIDSGMYISPVVVTSKKSPKVALIWTAEHQCGYDKLCSDIYYLESTNSGQDWIDAGNFSSFTPVNITNYGSSDAVRATGDLMGVYDMNDSLVISFTEFVDYEPINGYHSNNVNIMVWTKEWGRRKVADGNLYQMPPQSTLPVYTHTLNWPHIGVHNGTGNPSRLNQYYLVFTQYGGNDSTLWSDTAANGFLNGEVYLVASTNRGRTWSAPVNLTNSPTPGCTKGNCSGVSFSSCAEIVNDTVHIAYMSDLYSGSLAGMEQPSTDGTNNPVIYMKVPLASIDGVDTVIDVYPTLFPYENPVGPVLTDTFFVSNIGNTELIVDSIRHMYSATWLTINNGSSGFTIPEAGSPVPISFTVNEASLVPGFYIDTIKVYNNSSNSPVVKVTIRMVVDNSGATFHTPLWDTLDNGVVRISVSNVGNLANQYYGAGFYRIIGNDTTNNLLDASKFVALILSNGDTVVGLWIYDAQHLWPIETLWVKDTTATSTLQKPGTKVKIPPGNYILARTSNAVFFPFELGVEFPGPWFGFTMTDEFWLPKLPNPAWHPAFLLWCQTIQRMSAPPAWWPNNPAYDSLTTTVYFGKALDWDVYSEMDAVNFGWAAYRTGAIWQEGTDTSEYGNAYPNGFYALVAYLDSLDNTDPYAMHLVNNERYIYPTSGYVDEELYSIAADTDTNQLQYTDSLRYPGVIAPADFNSVVTDVRLMPPYDNSVVVNLLGVTGDSSDWFTGSRGCDSMATIYNSIRQALGLGQIDSLRYKLSCLYPDCIGKAGDANSSGTYTLADVVSIVNYIFNKPGCTPLPLCWLSGYLCRGDWNGSGTVSMSDVIQAVNYIFNKPGGPWNPLPVGLCCM
jgi:hypothetical protein